MKTKCKWYLGLYPYENSTNELGCYSWKKKIWDKNPTSRSWMLAILDNNPTALMPFNNES